MTEGPTHAILRLGHRGDGVAAGPVYAARTLPGEVVTGAVEGDRIPDPRIAVPSPDRVAPPCPHYRRCGACAVQHASDAFVAGWKAGIVRDALARVGIAAEIASVETSPPGTRRRAALSGRKTRKGAEVGFHLRGSDAIVAVPGCRVLTPALVAALPALERIARIAAPRGTEVTLHVADTETGIDLAIDTPRALDRDVALALAPLGRGFARIAWNEEPALQQVAPVVHLGRAPVTPPPRAFLQATRAGEAALVAAVTGALGGAARILDLFAGCGTFALPLAAAAPVHAVEGDRAMLAALSDGARHAPGLRAVTTEARDLFRNPLLPAEMARFDAAVIDPPRAGAAAQVAQVAASGLRRVAFVSCDPGTFARDAATLVAAGFAMGPVTVVDQFRWSAHVELVARFDRG